MSGWDPGSWGGGGGQQAEPNGLPRPAGEPSPVEAGWQDGGLGRQLMDGNEWPGSGPMGGFNIAHPQSHAGAKSYQQNAPNPPQAQPPLLTRLSSTIGSTSAGSIGTDYLPQGTQRSSSFEQSPVDVTGSVPYGARFEPGGQLPQHQRTQHPQRSHPPSDTHPRTSSDEHHAPSSSLMGAYAHSGYSSAHPYLPQPTASTSAARFAPNQSHYRTPYAPPQPTPSPYYNWPGAHYQPQQQLQSSQYAYSYAQAQPGYGYSQPLSSSSGPAGAYPTEQQWRPAGDAVAGQRAGTAESVGGGVDQPVAGGWDASRASAGQGGPWLGSNYSLGAEQLSQQTSQGRYPLPTQALGAGLQAPGPSLDPAISPRSVPTQLHSIDELDRQPLPGQPHLSASTDSAPPTSASQPPAYSSFYSSTSAPLERSDSSSLRRSGTAKRARTSTDSTASASKPSAVAKGKKPAGAADGPPKRKLTVDLEAKCGTCGVALARLICRGTAEEVAVPHRAVFTCLDCTPNAKPISSKRASGSAAAAASKSKAKSKTVQPLLNTSTSVNTFRKRNKKSFSDPSALTPCDVCLRDIATGAVLADDGETEVAFTVEVVCVRCDEAYMRCSDCGGGGGSRLGAGKWRCKELFVPGRKTCKLSHDRLGNLTEMDYDVFAIRDVPRDEMNEIIRQSETIFKNTLIAGMCIPEVLETQSAPFRSYDDIIHMTDNGWRGIQQLFNLDIEPTRSIRRYIGLRSTTPNPRKSQRARAAEAERPFQEGGVVLRPNKDIVGFVLAEFDFLIGSLFLAVVVPWGTADTFDATTRMLVALIGRAEADLAEMNAFKRQIGQPLLPEIKQIWTLMFFKRESRMMAHLEKKRGFFPVGEYLAKWADSSADEFAPAREVYIPRERLGDDWHVVVKRQLGVEDWTRPAAEAGASGRK